MRLEEFLSRFEGPRKRTTTGVLVRCPAHEDGEPSLSVDDGKDRILVKCFAGCAPRDVCEALGLGMAELFYEQKESRQEAPRAKRLVATYDYADEQGEVLYRKLRFEPKTFGWERLEGERWVSGLGDVRRVPYHLPDLATAKPGETVWLVEGEKDAENLRAAGARLTTSTKDWQEAWSELFAGLFVVLIQDNDPPGKKIADQVIRSLGKRPASVLSLTLPGATDGGDVSDYLRGGGSYAALVRLVSQRPDSFVSSAERALGERDDRIATAPRILSTGIPYLDHALTGIMPDDVLLCSAATGAGKTEAACAVGLAVAGSGKRVHMFALEAKPLEVERRIKYRLIANLYYADDRGYERPVVRYQEWAAGLLDRQLGKYEGEAHSQFEKLSKNLKTYYKSGDFTGSDFVRVAAQVAEESDLIILDHLHYLDSEEANENAGYKKITKLIRDSALTNGKPVLAVAHIRKSDRYSQRLVPTIEDIHGSSDIGKIATKAFMLARAEDQLSSRRHISNTYVQVIKNRTDGNVCRYVAMVGFDMRTNTYSDSYAMFQPRDNGREMVALTGDEIPHWAKGADRAPPTNERSEP